jgi:hypothetical protein
LKLQYDKLLPTVALEFNLRRYMKEKNKLADELMRIKRPINYGRAVTRRSLVSLHVSASRHSCRLHDKVRQTT